MQGNKDNNIPKQELQEITKECDPVIGDDKTNVLEPLEATVEGLPAVSVTNERKSIIQTRAQKRLSAGQTQHKPSSYCRNCAGCSGSSATPHKKTKK